MINKYGIVGIICGLLSCFQAQHLAAQRDSTSGVSQPPLATSDSGMVRHEVRQARSGWEKALALPGDIVFFPFGLLGSGMAKGAAYAQDIKLAAKLGKMFARDGNWGFYPTYVSRLGVGAGFYLKENPGSRTAFTASLTRGLRDRSSYSIGLEHLPFWSGAVVADLKLGYTFFSDDDFFGIGPQSRKADKSNYALEQVALDATFRAYLGQSSRMHLIFGFESERTESGKDDDFPSTDLIYSSADLPGLDQRIRLAKVNLSLSHDTRNRAGNPTTGGEHTLGAAAYTQIGGNRFAFWKADASIKRYFHLAYNRVVILRMVAQLTEPLGTRKIPFFYLSEIGRKETIRGYDRGRFRDRDKLICGLEYRYPVSRNIDCELFLDAGQVSPDMFERLALNDFKYGYGFGFRFWNQRGTVAKMQLGRSNDRIRFYLVLNE